MRQIRLALVLAVLIGIAAPAAADEMTLTQTGDLYRVSLTADGLAVSGRLADGSNVDLLVPQTTGIVASSYHVGVDQSSGALYVLWQENEGTDATVAFASYSEGTWSGPTIIAGGDGFAAVNPQLLVFRHSAEVETEVAGEPVVLEVEETLLHIVWWSFQELVGEGTAFYAGLPVDVNGLPDLNDLDPQPLSDLLAFGIACPEITDAAALAHPRLFVDPQSGNPHVFASDIGQCLFQILELRYQPNDPEIGPVAKRRHRVVIFGRSRMVPVRADVSLAFAKVEVGHELSLVIYWNKSDAVEYLKLDEDGWSEMRSLPLGDDLQLDRALELIETLTH